MPVFFSDHDNAKNTYFILFFNPYLPFLVFETSILQSAKVQHSLKVCSRKKNNMGKLAFHSSTDLSLNVLGGKHT